MLGAGLHGRSCPQMPASLPWSLFVFLNGSVIDLQHHVGCRCTARWFSYIYIVFIAHACTWKTHLWYTAVHVCVIRVHGAFFFSVRWPHALPWRPELRTSQDLPLRIRGLLEKGRLHEEAGCSPPQLPHPGRPALCLSEPWRANNVLSKRALGGETWGRTPSRGVSRKKSKVTRACQPIAWNPAQSKLRPADRD